VGISRIHLGVGGRGMHGRDIHAKPVLIGGMLSERHIIEHVQRIGPS